jgi:hypothetical protein
MRPRHVLLALVFVSCCGVTTTAQEPKPKPGPADKAPAKADKDKSDKKDQYPGYRTKKIEGATFHISEEVFKADVSAFERKPLEVLEDQCQLIAKALPPKALEVFRKQVIWVEWDEVQSGLGIQGQQRTRAAYVRSTPQVLAQLGKNPLQSKSIVIFSLKEIAAEVQPKKPFGKPLTLLHEFCHAFHHQVLGEDHAGVISAYQQAMERKLYDKMAYATVNSMEFFAETSCAYLDRLPYYPHTRDDLKKHDPVTFKLMESVWGKPAVTDSAKIPLPHTEKASTELSFPADVKFGLTITGPKPDPEKMTGKVVLIGYWGYFFTNVLDRFDALHNELSDYGLEVIAPNTIVTTVEALRAEAEKHKVRFTVVERAEIKDAKVGTALPPWGTAILFDHTGKCVYRGSAYDVDDRVRAAVGNALMTAACGPGAPPKAFQPIVDAFAAGAGPVAVLAKLTPLTKSSDADTKEKAKKLHDLILAPGEKALAAAQASARTDPLGAFLTAERVAARFKNTPLGPKANTLATSLRTDKAVAAELKTRALVADIEKLMIQLRTMRIDNSDAFRTKNQQTIAQLKAQFEQLQKHAPPAAAELEKAVREFTAP